MIKITIEMWPYGDRDKKYTIAEGEIINDCSGNSNLGNYKYNFSQKEQQQLIEGIVKKLKRNNGILDLTRKCLNDAEKNMRA